jgi:ankyrin repeat protein
MKRAVLLTLCLLWALTGACRLWLRAQQRQYTRNRQLIAALMNGDTGRARSLVEQGADPNTPYRPPPSPSMYELLRRLLRQTPPRDNASPTAFMLACGMDWNGPRPGEQPDQKSDSPDDSPLLQAMLRHGADVNARDENLGSPLIEAVTDDASGQEIELLIQHGAAINAQDIEGKTALFHAVFNANRGVIRQLLAHRADPNIAARDGTTPLFLAQHFRRADIVALLKQAGAKAMH